MGASDEDSDDRWGRLVAEAVAAATGHKAPAILRRGRGPAVRQARWMAVYLAHTALGWPQGRVGECFGLTREQVGRVCRALEDDRDDPLVDAVMAALDRGLREIVAARAAGGGGR